MEKKKLTFSKQLVIALFIVALIDMQMPFVLAFMGKDNIAETLAVAIVTEIIGVFATYSIKAYLETKQEEANKLTKELNNVEDTEESEG